MNLKSIPTVLLVDELRRRDDTASRLLARREEIVRELEAVEEELASIPDESEIVAAQGGETSAGAGRGARTPRARNRLSLGDALAQCMEIRAVVTPLEAAEYVRRNGYKTNARNFNMMVSNVLARDPRFRRVARGQYERIG